MMDEPVTEEINDEEEQTEVKLEDYSPLYVYKAGMNWNPVEKVIFERRSVRAFKPDPLPDGMIRRILEAGRFSPTAGNSQCWKFQVVKSPTIIAEMEKDAQSMARRFMMLLDYTRNGFKRLFMRNISKMLIRNMPGLINQLAPQPFILIKRIAEGKMKVFFDAPTLILVLTDKRGVGVPQVDSGICGQNMVLAAHSMGAATCWIGCVALLTSPFAGSVKRKWAKFFGIKKPYELLNVIALGWPKRRFDREVPREVQLVEWFDGGLQDKPRIERQGDDADKPTVPRLKGFASIINTQMQLLAKITSFQKKYAKANMVFLLEATDAYPAALLHIARGVCEISMVPKEECKNWKDTGAQSVLRCPSRQMLEIAAGKLNPVTAWMTRKIMIRGPLLALKLNGVFKLLVKELKTRKQ